MERVLNLNISKPIGSISSSPSQSDHTYVDNWAVLKKHLDTHLARIDSLSSALAQAIEHTNDIEQQIIAQSRDEIAKLAVDIAEMIIADKISRDDYDIEKIISESIRDIDDKSEIEVELNEHDEKICQDIISKDPNSPLKKIKISADKSIGKAQCRVKTQNGKIESFYKEQLEKIAQALDFKK